ncbi:MAG: glycosyltransferase [Solirubrobacterales bacterium]
MTKISIIVPVYNVEKYLPRCMESLLNQTLKDIEIIMVDDGSKDGSGVLCDQYALTDSRVKVIHKKNGGLGYARNSGIEVAKGEFLAFADSDDYVSLEMYDRLYNSAINSNADTCICGSNRVYSNGTIGVFENPVEKGRYVKDKIMDSILINLIGAPPDYPYDDYIGMPVWKGIYSRKIIDSSVLRFHSEREFISEDIIFQMDYYKCAESVAVIPDALYFHCENEFSLTTSYKPDRFKRYIDLYLELVKRACDMGIYENARLRIERTFIAASRICIIQEGANSNNIGKLKVLENINSICCDPILQNVLNNYPIFKLPVKQRIFSIFTKYRKSKILLLLVRLNSNN